MLRGGAGKIRNKVLWLEGEASEGRANSQPNGSAWLNHARYEASVGQGQSWLVIDYRVERMMGR